MTRIEGAVNIPQGQFVIPAGYGDNSVDNSASIFERTTCAPEDKVFLGEESSELFQEEVYNDKGQLEGIISRNENGDTVYVVGYRYREDGSVELIARAGVDENNWVLDYDEYYDKSGNLAAVKYYKDNVPERMEYYNEFGSVSDIHYYESDGYSVSRKEHYKNGTLVGESVLTEGGSWKYTDVTKEKAKELTRELYDDMSAKTWVIFDTTRDSFEENILQITPDNVMYVLEEYKKNYGEKGKESLLSAMVGEKGYKPLVEHVVKCIMEYARNRGYYVDDIETGFQEALSANKDSDVKDGLNSALERLKNRMSSYEAIDKPNGEIDGDFKQGKIGSCWLLATIKSIANTPKGLEMLNDSIQTNDDGSVTVTLRGVNKSYTISPEELEGIREYASGDADIRALELAVNKYMQENPQWEKDTIENGNSVLAAYQILIDQDTYREPWVFGILRYEGGGASSLGVMIIQDPEAVQVETFKDLIEKLKNSDDVVVTACTNMLGADKPTKITDHNTNKTVTIHRPHAYSVVGADDGYFYVVNPHDSSVEIKISVEEFRQVFDMVDIFEIN